MEKKNLHRAVSIFPLYLFVVLLLFLSLACSLSGSDAAQTPAVEGGAPVGAFSGGSRPDERNPATASVLEGPVEIGQPFLVCDTAVTVVGWETVETKESDIFQPEPGNRFITVEVVLVNLGKTSVETGWYSFNLFDAYGDGLPEGMFPEMYAHSQPLVSGLAPGERIRGMIGYEIPEDEQELSVEAVCYNGDTGADGEMMVELGSAPRSAEAPGRFEGEITPDPLTTGKSAMVKDVEITVTQVLAFPEEALDPEDPKVPTPPDWMTYLIVDMTLENKGEQDAELFTTSDMYVQDPEGVRYVCTGVKLYLDEPLESMFTLEPGDQVGGQLVVRVPKHAGHVNFVFEYGYGMAASRAYFLLA